MAKTSEKGKPEKGKSEKKAAVKEAAATVAAAQTVMPLRVDIQFPNITDLKQAIGFDADGNLIIALQFKARVDQYEIFRLVNLLKQPHGTLFATIGSPQSAMDFKFSKEGKIQILKAAIAQEKGKKLAPGKDHEEGAKATVIKPETNGDIVFKDITFNHIPEEEKPFGVVIDFTNGASDKPHVVAGRGKSATEAVVAGVKATSVDTFGPFMEPFEILEAVKKTEATDAQIKIIRAIEVGSFDIDEDKPKP